MMMKTKQIYFSKTSRNTINIFLFAKTSIFDKSRPLKFLVRLYSDINDRLWKPDIDPAVTFDKLCENSCFLRVNLIETNKAHISVFIADI